MQDLGVFYMPNERVALVIKNFDVKMNMWFDRDEQGYLLPKVYSAEINWGDSGIEHENQWVNFVTFYAIRLLMQVVKVSMYFLGPFVLDQIFEPVLTKFLWYYDLFIWLPEGVPGMNEWDYFDMDMRMAQAPQIYNGYMDFFFSGELYYRMSGCSNTFEHGDLLDFQSDADRSQMVISESAATCILNQYFASDLGRFQID
jgi:hypothetical protein